METVWLVRRRNYLRPCRVTPDTGFQTRGSPPMPAGASLARAATSVHHAHAAPFADLTFSGLIT